MTPSEARKALRALPEKVRCGLRHCPECRSYWTEDDFDKEPERQAILAASRGVEK